MKRRVKSVVKKFFDILKKPEMSILPGQLAFYLLLSLIPIMILCLLIASNFVNNTIVMQEFSSFLPSSLWNIIKPLITDAGSSSSSLNFEFVMVCYLLLASNGPISIIVTSNEMYKIKDHNMIYIRIKAFFMTIIILALLLFMILIPVFGDTILKALFRFFKLSYGQEFYWYFYKFLKIFISFVFVYIFIKLIYTIAPNKKIQSDTTTLGAVFTSIGWISATGIFSFYIGNIAKYNILYGNFANILILLLWIYLLAYLFVVGMALNINKYSFYKEQEKLKMEVEE